MPDLGILYNLTPYPPNVYPPIVHFDPDDIDCVDFESLWAVLLFIVQACWIIYCLEFFNLNKGLELVLEVSIDIIINYASSAFTPLKLFRPVDYDVAATVKLLQNGSSSKSVLLDSIEPRVTTTITEVETIEETEITQYKVKEKVHEPLSEESDISFKLAPVVESSESLQKITTSNSIDDLKSAIFADSISSPTSNYFEPFERIFSETCNLSTFEILRPHLKTSDCIMGGEGNSETPTDCLDDFLNQLQLNHLSDYFRVLGCTCTRDLRLLEKSELDAIQLVPRRRLQQHMSNIPHHHEAPPEGCSLNDFLQWFGLLHIEGFLNTIGVYSVTDLSYLKEDDLCLLRPVTRRRLLTSCGLCTRAA